jgi:hypothetical protein
VTATGDASRRGTRSALGAGRDVAERTGIRSALRAGPSSLRSSGTCRSRGRSVPGARAVVGRDDLGGCGTSDAGFSFGDIGPLRRPGSAHASERLHIFESRIRTS